MKYITVGNNQEWIDEENRRLMKQAKCKHLETKTQYFKNGKFSTRCVYCKAVISSDAMVAPDKIWIEVIL